MVKPHTEEEQAKNPLNDWIRYKTGAMPLEDYRLAKLKETISYVKDNSAFYGDHLSGVRADEIKSIADFERLPTTDFRDIIERGDEMLCVHPGEIERVVTLFTSGTTGEPKRLYFTKEDQELTIDFFHHGMKCLLSEDDSFLILLPCFTPGSVGALLQQGLMRLGCDTHRFGLVKDIDKTCEYMRTHDITSLVANPVQALKLAEAGRAAGYDIRLKSILLSTDHVPCAVAKRLSDIWGCSVFEHYGTTEMGLGGGVFCSRLRGYHMREADLYFEVVSPDGKKVADGEYGEIVFTTLTRKGMPLVRYRTGDCGRFIEEKCECGELGLMEKVRRRIGEGAVLKNGRRVFIDELDEIIFSLDHVTDYDVYVTAGELRITIYYEGTKPRQEDIASRISDGFDVTADVEVKKQDRVLSDVLVKRKLL